MEWNLMGWDEVGKVESCRVKLHVVEWRKIVLELSDVESVGAWRVNGSIKSRF